MEIKTKFNREQKVIVIFDDEIRQGTVTYIEIGVGFKNNVVISYKVEIDIKDNGVFTENFLEDKVFSSVEDLVQQSKERVKAGS